MITRGNSDKPRAGGGNRDSDVFLCYQFAAVGTPLRGCAARSGTRAVFAYGDPSPFVPLPIGWGEGCFRGAGLPRAALVARLPGATLMSSLRDFRASVLTNGAFSVKSKE